MAFPSPAEINATEGLGAILVYVNFVTNDVFINLTLIVLYIIVLAAIGLPKDNFELGAAIAGITTAVFATTLFLSVENLINSLTLGMTIAVALGGLLLLMRSPRKQ